MKKLNTLVLGMGLVSVSACALAATEIEEQRVDAYLNSYHPDLLDSLTKGGLDVSKLEFTNTTHAINADALRTIVPSIFPNTSAAARKACKANSGIFLENSYVATCVSPDGTFGNGSGLLGMTYNPAGTGTLTTPDFLRPGSPHEYFSISINGNVYTNNNSNGGGMMPGDTIPTTIQPLFYATQAGGVVATSVLNPSRGQQLTMKQKYSLDPDAREIILRTEIKNTGFLPIFNIQFARGLDPDQDQDPKFSPFNTFSTVNTKGHTFPGNPNIIVSPQNIVRAEGRTSQLAVSLYSIDPIKHDTCISSSWTTIPSLILNSSCGPAANIGDDSINIAFDVRDPVTNSNVLLAGETRVFSYRYQFGKLAKVIATSTSLLDDVK